MEPAEDGLAAGWAVAFDVTPLLLKVLCREGFAKPDEDATAALGEVASSCAVLN